MSETNPLLEFETEYPGLYEILVNGIPVYAALRDGVNVAVNGGDSGSAGNTLEADSGRVSIRRIVDSIIKLRRFRTAKTLVFTSSVYRRDKGRNLAAEFLMDKYPDTVIFEWPSRNEGFDFAYFDDKLRSKYCPLEWYLIKYKLYMLLHKKAYNRYCDECREKLKAIFPENIDELPQNYQRAIEYIRSSLPNSYAVTIISQNIFKKIFRKYQNIEYAVDFWGSARENIIPVLPGKPQSVELQHGAFNAIAMPGYIYPRFVKDCDLGFFKRQILVYGRKSKEILVNESIFLENFIQIIGNPRLIKYRNEFSINKQKKNLILFISQTFEQDGTGKDYYKSIIPFLQQIELVLKNDSKWSGYQLGVKLHPREKESIAELYKKQIPGIEVFDSRAELYHLFTCSYFLIMVSSTALFEAATFDVPSIMIKYNGIESKQTFGFEVKTISSIEDVIRILDELSDLQKYQDYVCYITDNAKRNI